MLRSLPTFAAGLLAASLGTTVPALAQKPARTPATRPAPAPTTVPDPNSQPLDPTPHPVLPLYSGSVPNSKPSQVKESTVTEGGGRFSVADVVQPTLTVYLPAPNAATGTAVIICPGGGYSRLAIGHEGYDVAQRFNEMGVAAFVLKYRLPNTRSQPDPSITPLLDVQQALRLVRAQATKYNINPERIGVMGFSAGGHLAATAATHFARPVGSNPGTESVRPAFSMLIYPVISFSDSLMHKGSRDQLLGPNASAAQVKEYSNELQVTAQTPPTFLVHAEDDTVVPVGNSLVYYQALARHKVPAEMHLYPKGGHGFGMNNSTTQDQWMERLREWLAANGWLSK